MVSHGLIIIFVTLLTLVNELLTIDLCKEDNTTDSTYKYYSRNVTTIACGCEIKKCVRKCCKSGFSLSKKFCIQNLSNPFKIPIYRNKTIAFSEMGRGGNFLIGVMNCSKYFRLNASDPSAKFYVQEEGSLWVPMYKKFYQNYEYCIDELYGGSALLCFPESQDLATSREINVVGMIISMPFLLATFLVYAILPESNLHRKALMNYVLTLLLAYIFLVTVQLYPGQFGDFSCALLGYMIIFFFLVSFFWMNVMCVDMWFAFSGMRGFNGRRIAERKRFLMYFAYAFGIPILHIIVVYLINEFGDKKSYYYPGVGDGRCFLRENWPNLLYFYGPMALLIAVNIVLFTLTAVKIQRVKKETSMLKQSESKRHSYEDDKQKFNLYVKLLFAMGINWTMEIVSWAIQWKMGSQPYVWYLTDFCNAMYGVFIFFMFVFKKKIWKSLKKRYYIFRGKPHLAHSMSVTQTTRASTTESGTTDHRLSELKNGRGGEERMLTQN